MSCDLSSEDEEETDDMEEDDVDWGESERFLSLRRRFCVKVIDFISFDCDGREMWTWMDKRWIFECFSWVECKWSVVVVVVGIVIYIIVDGANTM